MIKKILLLTFLISFVHSIEVPLAPAQLKKAEQKFKEDTTDYSKFEFSNTEKEEYYKLDVFMEVLLEETPAKDKLTEFENKALERMDELHDKLIKAIRAKKTFNAKINILFRYIQEYPEKIELIKKVIKAGADVNAKDEHGYTPLYYAMQNDNAKIVEILIDAGADIDAKDYLGQTPLVYAAYFNKPNVVEALLKAGKSPLEEFGKNKTTPLIYAAEKGHKNILDLFLKYSVDRKHMIEAMKKAIYEHQETLSVLKTQIKLDELSTILVSSKQNTTKGEYLKKKHFIKQLQNKYCVEPELKNDYVCKPF